MGLAHAHTRAPLSATRLLPNVTFAGRRNRPLLYVCTHVYAVHHVRVLLCTQRLAGADPSLGVEMASTGEVACFGPTHHDAFLKAMMSTGMRMPQKNILVSIQEQLRDERTLPTLQKLSSLGFSLYATEKTAEYLREQGVDVTLLYYGTGVEDGTARQEPCIDDFIEKRKIEMVLMFSNQYSERIFANYAIRRLAVDYGVPLITNMQVAKMFADSIEATGGTAGNLAALDPRSVHEFYEERGVVGA